MVAPRFTPREQLHPELTAGVRGGLVAAKDWFAFRRSAGMFAVTLAVHVGFLIALFAVFQVRSAPAAMSEAITRFTLSPPERQAEAKPAVPDIGARSASAIRRPTAIAPVAAPTLSASAGAVLPTGSRDTPDTPVAIPPASDPIVAPDVENFRKILQSHIASFRRYPASAIRAREEGTVLLGFHLARGGTVEDVEIIRSSGSGRLDKEAVATIFRASPMPALPDILPDSLSVSVPVIFVLKDEELRLAVLERR